MRCDVPILLYDRDCGFCRGWIGRWRRSTGPRVRYFPYDATRDRRRFGISAAEAARAVQLVEADGRLYQGAAAVFRTLRRSRSPWTRLFARLGLLPGIRALAELVYRWIARHRRTASRIQRRLLPRPAPGTPR